MIKAAIVPSDEEILQQDKRSLLAAQKAMKNLFDIIDGAPRGFADCYDLAGLYDELSILIRETDTQLNEWGI